MSGIVVAANRGPYSLVDDDDGVAVKEAAGGLAPSLAAALNEGEEEATWVATAMTPAEERAAESNEMPDLGGKISLRLVNVDAETYAAAYDVVANSTLWFCYHGLFDAARRPLFDQPWREAWEGFRRYHAAFCDRICEVADEGARVMVNDYHLPLLGAMLREKRRDLRTVHFTHTPFATAEELAMLPRDVRRELVEGMGGFGSCGFHTPRWEARFAAAAASLSDGPKTFAEPLGADCARLDAVAASSQCETALSDLSERLGDRAMILRSDRVELSKNILRGFRAFDALLSEHPELCGRVVFVARAYASRETLPEYLAYRSQAEHLAAVLNERWAPRCGGEPPIWLEVDDDFPASVAAFRRYDVLLVNPVRDGMNLVAKEGPSLNERDGVLVLSEQAGAHEELGDVALGVQPFDVLDTAAALFRALELPSEERARRGRQLRERCRNQPPARWFAHVMAKAR